MEPEQNINVETPEQNQVNDSAQSGNIMEEGLSAVKKPGKGLIAGMIVCAILAVAGIGFGVWAMMDGNAKTDELNKEKDQLVSQNEDLKKQNTELQDEIEIINSTTGGASAARKTCEGTYYGELELNNGGTATGLKYTYVLKSDGTFTADYGGVSSKAGTYTINDNTISMSGNREMGGPRDLIPSFATEDAIIADDCSSISLMNSFDNTYSFVLMRTQ